MLILSIDTATSVASVAIADGEQLLGEFTINNKKTHSVNLMPMLDELMKKTDKRMEEIEGFAACIGPGSFTGIRIGVTAIKTMAYTMKKPVVGINTLDVLAASAGYFNGIIQPIMDARNRQVYTASYTNNGKGLQRFGDYDGCELDNILNLLGKQERDILFTGDAVNLYKDEIASKFGQRSYFSPMHLVQPRASAVIQLAISEFTKGSTMNAENLLPFYLRKSQAEQELERKRK